MPTIEFTDRDAVTRTQTATGALARAAAAATRAPSVFNTQPWRWRITHETAELRADRSRQLDTVDPDGRLLIMSCGVALHHARTALEGTGARVAVDRLPEPDDPDALARLRVTASGEPTPGAVRRQRALALRQSDRRPFADAPVPDRALHALRAAAEAEGAHLHVLRPADVPALTVAAARASATEFADPAYRAELAAWAGRPAGSPDGLPTVAPAGGPRPVPLRDFTGTGSPSSTGDLQDRAARYAVLFTDDDTPAAWITAGEALSAVLLTATEERLGISPMSDVVEVPAARRLLRDLLAGVGHPMIVLRIGVPGDGAALPRAPRRDVTDVVTHEPDGR